MLMRQGPQAIRAFEVLCYVTGALLSAFFLAQLAQGESQRQGDIASFELDLSGTQSPDTSLWNAGRVKDYEASLSADLPDVLGVLEIPSASLKVPVYATNSDLVMDRGAGIIDGMAYPHEPGNIGISGHRDGYFRVLKDVKVGDRISLQTLEGPKNFRIKETQVVEIGDISLLQDTDEQSVTLVTCYPFYFVGHAPQRFIVTATLDTTYVNQN